jgi:hypothetical protein
MLQQIATFQIFGLPLILYGGIITFLCLIMTALVPILNQRNITHLPFKLHIWMARITIALALIHGILGMALFL